VRDHTLWPLIWDSLDALTALYGPAINRATEDLGISTVPRSAAAGRHIAAMANPAARSFVARCGGEGMPQTCF
jgi:hypothetical protein